MKRHVAFFCNFLCAAALLGAGGNLPAETQEEDTRGIVVQNKAPSEVGCPVARYAVRFGKEASVTLSAGPASLAPGSRLAPAGKAWIYSHNRYFSDLFVVEGLR